MPDSLRAKTWERPAWLDVVVQAKERALETLTPEQKAEAEAAKVEWRKRADARRQTRLERLTRIVELMNTGFTAAEIGAAIGRTPRRIQSFLKDRGIYLNRSRGEVRYSVEVSIEHRTAIRALAARMGMTEVEVLNAFIDATLDHDGQLARYILRNPEAFRAAIVKDFTAAVPSPS
jgi:hypothetical protein